MTFESQLEIGESVGQQRASRKASVQLAINSLQLLPFNSFFGILSLFLSFFFLCLIIKFSLTATCSDIYQDSNQVLFKMCPGLKDVPCDRTVHMGQSDDPRCPLHLTLPPPMYQPEQEAPPQEEFTPMSKDMYLSAAELQPTENLPLEFSDVRRNDSHLPTSSL